MNSAAKIREVGFSSVLRVVKIIAKSADVRQLLVNSPAREQCHSSTTGVAYSGRGNHECSPVVHVPGSNNGGL
ncbi:hypothetical protein V5799_023378 [Amblyomma americanum]|uniref:Uncharacterized protein n=1 Tax=Amblyomma americanum TaxID=6943 RepID=A0AAQ4FHU0_AMBAM